MFEPGTYITTWGGIVDAFLHKERISVRVGGWICPVAVDGRIHHCVSPAEHLLAQLPEKPAPGVETTEKIRSVMMGLSGPIGDKFRALGGATAPEGQVCKMITVAAGLKF